MKKTILFILALITFYSCDFESSSVTLNANLYKDADGITIKNLDSFDYLEATIKLNDQYEYNISPYIVRSGDDMYFGYHKFTTKDGTRFNYSQTDVRNISISCKLPDGKYGFVYAEFR